MDHLWVHCHICFQKHLIDITSFRLFCSNTLIILELFFQIVEIVQFMRQNS